MIRTTFILCFLALSAIVRSQVSLEATGGYLFKRDTYVDKYSDYYKLDRHVFTTGFGLDFDLEYVSNRFDWYLVDQFFKLIQIDSNFANTDTIFTRELNINRRIFNVGYTLFLHPFEFRKWGVTPYLGFSLSYLQWGRNHNRNTYESDSLTSSQVTNGHFLSKNVGVNVFLGLRFSYFISEKQELLLDADLRRSITDISFYESRREIRLNLGYKYHFGKDLEEFTGINKNNSARFRPGVEFSANYGMDFTSFDPKYAKNHPYPEPISLSVYDPNIKDGALESKNQVFAHGSLALSDYNLSLLARIDRIRLSCGFSYQQAQISYTRNSVFVPFAYYPATVNPYYTFSRTDSIELIASRQGMAFTGSFGFDLLDPDFRVNIIPVLSFAYNFSSYHYAKNDFRSDIHFHSFVPGENEVHYDAEIHKKATDVIQYRENEKFMTFFGLYLSCKLNSNTSLYVRYANDNHRVLTDDALRIKQKHLFGFGLSYFFR